MNRKEWLAWRKKGIGSSDAAIIMGVSPWATKLDLYEDKISDSVEEDTSNQFVKDIGNELEPKVRSLYSLLSGEEFNVALVEMEKFPFIRASLDGRNDTKKKIIEIKLLGKDDYELAQKGKVPEKYQPQVQHQLIVSQADVCDFLGYPYSKYMEERTVVAEHLVVVPVRNDDVYQGNLMSQEMQFWQENVLKKKPPIPSDKDYKPLKGVTPLIKEWKNLKAISDRVESELEEIRAKILAKAEEAKHPRLLCDGVRIRQESRVGNVNYKNVPELKGVDLDKYRGKGSVSWKFEIIDEE